MNYDDRNPILRDVIFRHAIENDLPALEWDGKFSHFRHLYCDIFESTKKGETIMWLADLIKVGIIGQLFAQLWSSKPELADGRTRAYFFAIRVRDPYQNQGIGSKLLDIAEKDILARGYSWCTLNVNKDNGTARQFYEKLGYKVVGSEPGTWSYIDQNGKLHEVNEPSWRMEKQLR
jgi:ribosomal protein S18 acetylase RimI-like enzyme